MIEVSPDDLQRLQRESTATRTDIQRVIVMLAGDPMVTDRNSPDHVENSIMGRLRSGDRRMDSMEQRSADAITKLAEAIESLQQNKFGWENTVIPFVKKNWKWLALIFSAGLYVLFDKGIIG